MAASQVFLHGTWSLGLDKEWDVLGPFPIHAREQHFISPAFPLNLSEPIDYDRLWPSSYADGANVGWSKATMGPEGVIEVSFPDIRWKSLRATEGWVGLQHHAILRTTLTLYPSMDVLRNPRLMVNLKQGSYFSLRQHCSDLSAFVPQWYAGNIYDMEHALPNVVELPVAPSLKGPTKYDLFVSGDYEIRLFGDPNVQNSDTPVQKLGINVQVQDDSGPFSLQPSQNVLCDFVAGYAFGNTIGVGIQSLHGWWTVSDIKVHEQQVKMRLLRPVTIAPTQTRIVPFILDQTAPFHDGNLDAQITLTSGNSSRILSITLPVKHQRSLGQNLERQIIKGSVLFGSSMPSSFLAIPPTSSTNFPGPPILALHGAGVDVLTMNFFANSLPENRHSWIVIPTGRTSWGLDWHGPSTKDAWTSLEGLRSILEKTPNDGLNGLSGLPPDGKVVVIGHSNGGQGTWYMAARFPDRVIAAIPAAGYIKSQAYIHLLLARGAHFIDPSLRSILESSLTPDDNDLHVSNLVDTSVYAIHGGSDENVPVWHTREAVGLLKTWYPSHNVTFQEDAGKGHWYPDIFGNPATQSFLDRVTSEEFQRVQTGSFTLTVTDPQSSGSLRGWKVNELRVPGRIGRLHVREANNVFAVETTNIQSFTIPASTGTLVIEVDDQKFGLEGYEKSCHMQRDGTGLWKAGEATPLVQPPGRIQSILSTDGPITIVVSDAQNRQELSLALRLAHVLNLYHRLDSEIVAETTALERTHSASWDVGNVVFIGRASSSFAQEILGQGRTAVRITAAEVYVGSRKFAKPGQAVLLTHPHPTRSGLMLMLLYTDAQGLEKAARLFPFRTGIAVPDWVVTGSRMDSLGAGGIDAAGVWTVDWKLSDAMSWFS